MPNRDIGGRFLSVPLGMRFWDKVQKTDGCWLWTGSVERNGYARMEVRLDERELVHRIAWALIHGPIPDNMCVLHRCDVRHCVNPAHLFLGTKGENNTDRRDKGRNDDRRVPKNPLAKLTDEQVIEIRNATLGSRALAKLYPVSARTIRKLRSGFGWKHLNG